MLEIALCKCFEYWQTHKKESKLLMRDDLSAILYKPYDSIWIKCLKAYRCRERSPMHRSALLWAAYTLFPETGLKMMTDEPPMT